MEILEFTNLYNKNYTRFHKKKKKKNKQLKANSRAHTSIHFNKFIRKSFILLL